MLSVFSVAEGIVKTRKESQPWRYTDLSGLHSSESLSNVLYNVTLCLAGKVEFTFP